MAQENKYGKITVEHGSIPEDEPVFLLRAQDVAAIGAIQEYLDLCVQAGSPPQHIEGIDAAIARFANWRSEHGSKIPGTSRTEGV